MPKTNQETNSFTYNDYCGWDDDTRWEIIEGEAFAMAPAPTRLHQQISGALFSQIYQFLKNRLCSVYAVPFDVRLPENDETDDSTTTVVQPDISIICDLTKLDKKGCRGAPDWIIEILSPNTAARDEIYKLALYEKHQVKEYWHIHPVDRIVTQFILGESNKYGKAIIKEAKGLLMPSGFPELAINLDECFSD